MAGQTLPFAMHACNKTGCARDARKPIKQVGTATGQLFGHLETCQPALALQLRANSKHSPVEIDEDGNEYAVFSFDELFDSHALFVEKCFRGLDHFYDTRADNGLVEWVRSFEKRAALPHAQTCEQLLECYEELYDENILRLIERHLEAFGEPCAGSTTDIWSLSSCRESFACLRGSFVLDGDVVAQVTGMESYKGTLVDMCPILEFSRMEETRHTGAAIARWKSKALARWKCENAIGLATEDGASPNKKANKILKQDMAVCTPHDIARAVLIATGEDGTPCKNSECKALIARSSKQASSFSRSVVASKALQEAQLEADADLKEHQTLTTKTKNKTRWLGLWNMCNRNRRLGPEIRIALTGDSDGDCAEAPAAVAVRPVARDSSDDDSSDRDSEGDDQTEANRVASKQFPLAHRCLALRDFRDTDVLESLLDRPRETTQLVQDETKGFGEGLDIGLTWLAIKVSCTTAPHMQRCPLLALL